jgi:hypothetical protein
MKRERLALVALMLCVAAPAHAQQQAAPDRGTTVARFLSGAAAAFGIHEAGHGAAALSFGARPRIKKIDYAGFPFFAIDHATVSPAKEFVISSAGFWSQHAGSELILSTHPALRHERSPVFKGMLAFNLATSAVYSVAAFGAFGPEERDTRGMAVSLGRSGVSERAIGALVLAPAVLDGYRYLRPDAAWARWASRGMKVLAVVLVVHAREQ